MFREWGFLLTEMIGLLLLAALLGLFVGWLIWGRRKVVSIEVHKALKGDRDRLSTDLANCRKTQVDRDTRISDLQGQIDGLNEDLAQARNDADLTRAEVAAARKAATDAQHDAYEARTEAEASRVFAASSTPLIPIDIRPSQPLPGEVDLENRKGNWRYEAEKTAVPSPVVSEQTGQDYDGDGTVEGTNEGVKPAVLSGPRGGKGDDLKQIKGIGTKLEELCHDLGFFHFDQIAAWTDAEVAWVDANLLGFKGRVTRDKWVAQARLLASGAETDFSKRVKDGDVY